MLNEWVFHKIWTGSGSWITTILLQLHPHKCVILFIYQDCPVCRMWHSTTFRICKYRNHHKLPNYVDLILSDSALFFHSLFHVFAYALPISKAPYISDCTPHSIYHGTTHIFILMQWTPVWITKWAEAAHDWIMITEIGRCELRTANFHSPPKSLLLSKQVGSRPSSKQHLMDDRPLIPAPITATFLAMVCSVWTSRKVLYGWPLQSCAVYKT